MSACIELRCYSCGQRPDLASARAARFAVTECMIPQKHLDIVPGDPPSVAGGDARSRAFTDPIMRYQFKGFSESDMLRDEGAW